MKESTRKIFRNVILGTIKVEKRIYFSTGIKMRLLKKWFDWQSHNNQKALEENAEKKSRDYERKMSEMLATAHGWMQKEEKLRILREAREKRAAAEASIRGAKA